MKNNILLTFVIIAALSIHGPAAYAQGLDASLSLKYAPEAVGKRVAENVVSRRFGWRYQRVCAYYGSLIFAEATADKNISSKIRKGYNGFYKGPKFNLKGHVDYNVFGIWPFELYRQTHEAGLLKKPKYLADHEFAKPRNDGLSAFSRFWVDDMYMVGSLQVQAFKSTGDTTYLNRAARTLKIYCDSLQRPNGLFYHRPDVPFYWGRGNGWAAAAFAELIPVLPTNHPYFNALQSYYTLMMRALLKNQGEDGMWHQVLDDSDSYAETSCTGMFIYSMATGIRCGWLSEGRYRDAIQRAWDSLATYVDEKGRTRQVCIGTNAKNNKSHYLTRPTKTGNFHGQAAVLWAATSLLSLQQ